VRIERGRAHPSNVGGTGGKHASEYSSIARRVAATFDGPGYAQPIGTMKRRVEEFLESHVPYQLVMGTDFAFVNVKHEEVNGWKLP